MQDAEAAEADQNRAFRPTTTADELAERLRQGLLDGAFAPGEVLSSRRIAETEGVSVIPARDALRGLVAEGALVFRDSRTIVVPVLGSGTLDELRYARLALEGELADRAFPSLAGRISDLRATDAAVTAALRARDLRAYMRHNRALHFIVYETAGSEVLIDLARALWLRFAPSMRIVCEAFDGRPPRDDHHQTAIAALAAGDRRAFRRSIEADIAQGMDMLLDHSRGATPRPPNEGETA